METIDDSKIDKCDQACKNELRMYVCTYVNCHIFQLCVAVTRILVLLHMRTKLPRTSKIHRKSIE